MSCTNISPSPSLSALVPQRQGIDRLALKRKQCLEARARKLKAVNLSGIEDPKPGLREEANLDAESTTDSVVFDSHASDIPNLRAAGSSGEFSVHSDWTNSASDTNPGHFLSPVKDLISFGFDSQPSSKENSNSNSKSSVPFSNYSSTSSVAFSNKQNHTDNDMTGDSVVFESSSHTQSTSKESVVFADTSHKPHPQISAYIESEVSHHPIDITLSSHNDIEDDDNKPSSQVSDTSTSKLYLYIQMQLYQEDTLKEWLAKNTLSRDRHMILTIFDEIVCAVDYVHKQGLMHRDLKVSRLKSSIIL